MASAQVQCIRKRPWHHDPHERIQAIGGHNAGSHWVMSEDQAIRSIEAGEWKFFVSVGGRSVWVVVAVHNGRKYLKTEADDNEPNNLLSLPECP